MNTTALGKMEGCFLVLLLLAAFSSVQIQGNFLQKSISELKKLRNEINVAASFDQGKADLIFLLDESGSLSPTNFQDEKRFVRNLLNNMHVGPEATRVEVIPFASSASIFIDYISAPTLDKNKCTFNEKFPQLTFWRGATNMNQAFKLAYEVVGGIYSNHKRVGAKTVVILLSDGEWNWGGDPAPWANKLKTLKTEIFTLAVGAYTVYDKLKVLATSADHAFYLSGFTEFNKLAVYIRGGELCRWLSMYFLFF